MSGPRALAAALLLAAGTTGAGMAGAEPTRPLATPTVVPLPELGSAAAPADASAAPTPQADPACGGAGWAALAEARARSAPLGLPPVPHPEGEPPTAARIELGRQLFFDRRLSANGTMSCAMCHVPEQGFTSHELRTAVGVEGRSVKRNAPTLINVGYVTELFHDGRDPALETQYLGPLLAMNEMANPSAGQVVARIAGMEEYQQGFSAAFGAPPSTDRIGAALAAYQRSLVAGGSAFDRARYGGEGAALDPAAARGLALFTGKAGCSACHAIGADHALLSDNAFHDNGYGFMREAERQTPAPTARVEVIPGVVYEVERSYIASVGGVREPDLGRYEATGRPEDRWRFRTPSLRNVALTAPYMHDGGFATLDEVVAFYDGGGFPHPEQDPRIRPLGLSDAERAEVVAFLRSLTSPAVPCLSGEARSARPGNY